MYQMSKNAAKGGHKAASHRASSSHSFQDHNPYVLKSMYAKTVTNENKMFAATRVPGSRDDYSVPSEMQGATRNQQVGPSV